MEIIFIVMALAFASVLILLVLLAAAGISAAFGASFHAVFVNGLWALLLPPALVLPGYLFWRNKFGGFRSDGAGGQLLIIMPEDELSIALFSDGNSFSPALEIIESFILAVRAENTGKGA